MRRVRNYIVSVRSFNINLMVDLEENGGSKKI